MKKSTLVTPAVVMTLIASVLTGLQAHAQERNWVPVTGVEALREFMSGLIAERKLPGGNVSRAEYRADGTGVLYAWGERFPRTWEVEGDDRVCFRVEGERRCFELEQNAAAADRYRIREVTTGTLYEFTVVGRQAVAKGPPGELGPRGGPGAPSADEIAKQLANPNTALATLTTKLQVRTFTGDLPNAGDQAGTTLLVQPSFPFPLATGATVFFRPAIPLLLDQPVFNVGRRDFDSKAGLGDITFDLAYGRTLKTGFLGAVGLVSTIPTATRDELGNGRWTLGPELLIGKLSQTYVLGAFPNHQWDVGGSGEKDISLTTLQLFGIYLPGGGWNVGTSPIMSYDHIANQWTIPLNVTVGKTYVFGGRPWKLGLGVNYYVEQPDAFGPQWLVEFSVAPVVENVFARWFR